MNTRVFFGGMGTLINLIVWMAFILVKTDQIVYFKYVQFCACQLHLGEAILVRKRRRKIGRDQSSTARANVKGPE